MKNLAVRFRVDFGNARHRHGEGKRCPAPLDAENWNCLAISESKYPRAAVVPSAEV
jgi:hypothetical protein